MSLVSAELTTGYFDAPFLYPVHSHGEAAWTTSDSTSPKGPLCCQGRNVVGLSLFPLQIPVNEASQCAGKVGSFIPTDSVQDSSWNGNFSILTPILSIFSPDLERPSFLGLSCDSDSLLTEQRLPTVPNHSWLEVEESLKNNTPRQMQWVWSISWKLYLTPFLVTSRKIKTNNPHTFQNNPTCLWWEWRDWQKVAILNHSGRG